jgi:hypothetical protein
MKEDLLKIIRDIIKLLTTCGWKDKAEWFQDKERKIGELDIESQNFKKELINLKKILVGMGSLDDLPLYPDKGSGLSEEDARFKQTELVGKLGEVIGNLLGPVE